MKRQAKKTKKRNMQDVPLKYYQSLRRDHNALKKRMEALEEWAWKISEAVVELAGGRK